MRRAIAPLLDAVKARGGTIDRMSPDGFSAFFNAPLDDPDHAAKACDCALGFVQAVEEVNRANGIHDPIRIGIGIDTGPGIVGNFGSEEQPDYAAVGRSASRAEALARLSAEYGAAILAGPATRDGAEAGFAFLPLDILPDERHAFAPLCALLGPPLSRANPKFLALKSFHEHIFEACQTQQWGEARKLIAQARGLSEANPVLYELYLQRIAHYEAQGAADWRGFIAPVQG
jgi:adenylate cyclase